MNSEQPQYSASGQVRSWAGKHGFSHWVVAILWLIVALILFQIVAGLVVVGLLIATEGTISLADIEEVMISRIDLLFIGNSIGQILFIGLATFVVVNLNRGAESKRDFLRIKWFDDSPKYIFYGVILMVVVQPIIVYLGYLNSLLPIPENLIDIQISQYEMIEEFLARDGIVLFGLLNIALVPAVCEEVLFRGYVMRTFEKSWGVVMAILISGIVFGLFHIQPGNILPLATLGMALALMTWLSGSIWPAVAAHFINNGAAVVLGARFPELIFQDVGIETLPPVWLLILSILITIGIIYVMVEQSNRKN